MSYANTLSCRTLLYICKISEDSELLHQVYLTESDSSQILANTPEPEVSQDLSIM